MAGDNWGETAKNAGDDQLQILHFQQTGAMRDANAAFDSSVERLLWAVQVALAGAPSGKIMPRRRMSDVSGVSITRSGCSPTAGAR
jgi:hypothetical protein